MMLSVISLALLALLPATSAADGATGADAVDGHVLTPTRAQLLAALVDAGVSMTNSAEQLVATERSLPSAEAQGLPSEFAGALKTLSTMNAGLRSRLIRLSEELSTLFTTGSSVALPEVLDDLRTFPAKNSDDLQAALDAVPSWTRDCKSPGANGLYANFVGLRQQHRRLDDEMRGVVYDLAPRREAQAATDGELAGLEERLNLQRGRRAGEEYEGARYLGANLHRWNMLRTKVAHQLAHHFTSAQESSRARTVGGASRDELEQRLQGQEEHLRGLVEQHRALSSERDEIGKKLRTFLKSMISGCFTATSGEVSVSQRFKVLRGGRGVVVQATEEFANFLNGTLAGSLPRTVQMLEELLEPYRQSGSQAFTLPKTWHAKPRIGRWWEWIGGSDGGDGEPAIQDETMTFVEFERRFAAAKRKFSVHVSAGEPIVFAYLLWLLMQDVLGQADPGADSREILALPAPTVPTEQHESISAPALL